MSERENSGWFRSVVAFIVGEVKFHFTHFETREFFLKLAIGSAFACGFLAFLFFKVPSLRTVFVWGAISGFVGFSVLEIGGSIVGWFYQQGVFRGAIEGLGYVALFVVGGSVVAIGGVYCMLGGVLLGGGLMVVAFAVVPSVGQPFVFVAYGVFAVAWLANGMNFVEDLKLSGSRLLPPPFGMGQWVYRIAR